MSDRTVASSAGAELPKGFEPAGIEQRWIDAWARAELGTADPNSGAESFAMVIPPPNVTGELHLGHALDQTLQDIVARWKRMAGYDVLWLPGTDHAGIATQNVVEKALQREGLDRRQLGREEFERRVWAWKDEYGNRILDQMRRLGFSVDWSRLRFTLDEGMSRAVRKVFVELYREGLIYRGEYMVNWCPKDQTAISDLEVKYREVEGKLYRIRYPLEGEAEAALEVETTRPETMLGDTALAVHPRDDRYRRYVGRTAILPLLQRRIPVIADEFVDPEFGTGVVKVTPAHDPNDYEAGLRHGLERIEVIGPDGRMTEAAGVYAGLDRFEARARVLEDLRAQGALAGERPYRHMVGHSDRSDAVIEPRVSTQWFVRMEPLARAALAAAEEGRVRFHPSNQFKVFREWMTNIRDWCISRQLWWGHRIPAWYDEDTGEVIVSMEDPVARPGQRLRQDPDVLDTWFSSALFPFSTLGWPEDTPELRRYYPTQLLVTGYDILFFWVARMIMMGLKFCGEVPFRDVYLHGLIRDEQGVKMSKSRGNGVDPLELVEEFGADAVRFTLAAMATPGTDLIFSRERMAGYRAFANKLWNAARFSLMNIGDGQEALQAAADAADPTPATLADRWILSRLAELVPAVEADLGKYRFDEAAQRLYAFVWHEFCDWYLEMAKVTLHGEDGEQRRATRGTLLAALELLLRSLHPYMPFITEELWSRLPGDRGLLALAPWAAVQEEWRDAEVEETVGLLQGVATEVRRLRAEAGLEPGRRAPIVLLAEQEERRHGLEALLPWLLPLVRAERVDVRARADGDGCLTGVVGDVQVLLPLAGVVDSERQRERLERELARVQEEVGRLKARLDNPDFLSKAPAEVVQKARARYAELAAEEQRLGQQLAALAG